MLEAERFCAAPALRGRSAAEEAAAAEEEQKLGILRREARESSATPASSRWPEPGETVQEQARARGDADSSSANTWRRIGLLDDDRLTGLPLRRSFRVYSVRILLRVDTFADWKLLRTYIPARLGEIGVRELVRRKLA